MTPQEAPAFLLAIGQWGIDSGIYALMNTRWGWPIAEIVHFVGLCLLFGTVGLFDLRLLGLAHGIALAALHRMVPFGILGFLLCLGSGLLFFVSAPLEYFLNPAWQLKMALMLLAGVNMALFYATVAGNVFALGPCCWVGVIGCGRVITAFRPFMD
jgi:hypothetical protein